MRYNVFVAPSGITCASLAVALGGVFTQPIAVWRRSALGSALDVVDVSRAETWSDGARARGDVRDVRRRIVSGVRVQGAARKASARATRVERRDEAKKRKEKT